MKPESVRALMWFSIILLVLGWLVMSPAISLLLAAIALLCSLPVIFSGALVPRLTGVLLLAGSIGLISVHYQEANQQLQAYRQHVTKSSTSTSSIVPSRK